MISYPALVHLETKTPHPLGVSESFLIGRNETADVCVFDRTCSRHHFRIVRHEGRYYAQPLNAANPTYLNGQPLRRPGLLEHGAIVQAGQTRFQFLLKAPGEQTAGKASQIPVPQATSQTVLQTSVPGAEDFPEGTVIPLSGTKVIGREQGRVQILLPHPQVSRIHASVTLQGTSALLADLNSANGTFVNGRRIRALTTLHAGDQLDVGPFALQFTGSALIPRARSNNVELVARGVTRVVKNRETGKPMTLLEDVTLVVRPREFVCLLGPSGSGKSTLMSALSGRTSADTGAVLLNGKDLHANFEALKQDIAVVPQKDVLHDPLPLGKALWYTAKLRLPPDTSRKEIESALHEMLETVGLTRCRATAIRHLSGGQVKRASLANEILCKPSLLFLDEVTSGLDEQTDREVMNLFRSLADAGKTVVCITHSLANVERTCHLVVILTPGGKLAFVGKPAEALQYFHIDRLGDVYERLAPPKPTPEEERKDPTLAKRLAEESARKWQQAFLKSPLWQRYVIDRLPPDMGGPPAAAFVPPVRLGQRLRMFLSQTVLLTRRYAAIWRADYPSLLAMVGQALVVAVLLGILFGDLSKLTTENELIPGADHARRSVNLLFLLAVSSFWFGCNNAAKEIVKERTVYTRERDFNLRVESYYASKLLLLTACSWVQTVLLFVIVRNWCAPPGSAGSELTMLLGLALAGVTLGLAISACSATEEMAITLIPLAIIPQIILSGAIVKLEGLSKGLALAGITTYWGKRGLDACLPDKVAEAAEKAFGLEKHSPSGALLVLLGHAVVCIVVALAVLHGQSRRRGGRPARARPAGGTRSAPQI
jgi:ABC-type multidrug transport system ATPase subunit